MNMSPLKKSALFGSLLMLSASVGAHTGINTVYSFSDGFMHPWTGIDHLLVMLAVGFWGSVRISLAVWLLPVCFLLAMAAGALLHFAGFALTGAEQWVALSVLLAGLMLWRNWQTSSGFASIAVAAFAACHGYVHAVEIGPEADQLAYASGFLSMAVLLLCFGMATRRLSANRFKSLRIGFGIVTTVTGLVLLTGY